MKSQPYASTWSISRVFKALLGLGIFKITIFVAIGVGYTPSLSFLNDFAVQFEQYATETGLIQKPDTASGGFASPTAEAPQSASAPVGKDPAIFSVIPARNEPQVDPQGSAAVRAVLGASGQRRQASTNAVQQQAPQATPVTPVVQQPKQEDISWWDDFSALKNLPIPRLGVDQVAYAASLDTPLSEPPAPPVSQGTSPFTPPAQILPAGVAGPKVTPQTGVSATESLLVPTTNPPAPQLDNYMPPEDPNQKEQELARREQEILLLQRQMEQRLQELQSAEKKVQDMLKEAKNTEAQKVNSLIAMYSNMKPRQAGAALESLDDNIAAKILISMKAKEAGEILSYMNPVKTAKLTELLSRMRIEQ